MARIGPAEVRERYEVEPRQVPDFIALRGDPSDKLPGAPGVGPKGAAGAAARTRHAGGGSSPRAGCRRLPKQLRFFRAIATMDPTAPVPPLTDQVWTLGQGGCACPRDGGCRSWRSGSTQWPRTQDCWTAVRATRAVTAASASPRSPSSTAISATMTISGIRSPSHKLRSRLIELTLASSMSRAGRCRSGP